jgi:ABC-type Zn2+ transport system substrate-binding protein/surface adhesin
MGLDPVDYQIYRSLNMIDNEGNQNVDFHDHDDEEEHDHDHEEFDDKLHKWYGLLLAEIVIS